MQSEEKEEITACLLAMDSSVGKETSEKRTLICCCCYLIPVDSSELLVELSKKSELLVEIKMSC
jgi:hypothetical protein